MMWGLLDAPGRFRCALHFVQLLGILQHALRVPPLALHLTTQHSWSFLKRFGSSPGAFCFFVLPYVRDTPERYEVLPLRLLRSERHQDRHDHLVLDAPCTRLDSNEGLQIDCLEL